MKIPPHLPRSWRAAVTLVLFAALPGSLQTAVGAASDDAPLGSADFRYALPWWQSAINLPDAPDKVLVGKEGQVLLDFAKTKVPSHSATAARRRHFDINLLPEIEGGAPWLRQQTVSARAAVMQTWKNAGGVEVREDAFAVTPDRAPAGTAQRTVILLTLHNPTAAPATRRPMLRVLSIQPFTWSESERRLVIGDTTVVSASPAIVSLEKPGAEEALLSLPEIALAPGETSQVVFSLDRLSAPAATLPPPTPAEGVVLRDAAQHWWESADLPYSIVQVPNAGIQAMIESCVRNIWQAREIKHGLPAFHVGPTVYRGLWIVDGSFLLETAAMLGRAPDARAGLDYMLSQQKPDGSFDREGSYWKENGIVLWAVTRHAVLTNDRAWLGARWPALRRIVQAIRNLRAKTAADPQALDRGLMPGGLVDGGIDNRQELRPEFSNTYWTLAGLKALIASAHWLGEEKDAAAWQADYSDMEAILRRAMTRDTRHDAHGNAYVPTMMANAGDFSPQKGQWAFCHAVYPGQVFAADDPMVVSQLAMLRATEVEGMVYDTGWMRDGIWNYFASFYGHAQLWSGHGREAAHVLYDFARHAAPTRVWREEQKPIGQGNDEVGDMPHNWASAEFIRLTTHLLGLDRGNELHLLEGFPPEWAGPGMVTRLNGVLTPFGPLQLEVRVAADGRHATLHVQRLAVRPPAKLVLHLAGLTGEKRTIELPVNRDVDQSFATSNR